MFNSSSELLGKGRADSRSRWWSCFGDIAGASASWVSDAKSEWTDQVGFESSWSRSTTGLDELYREGILGRLVLGDDLWYRAWVRVCALIRSTRAAICYECKRMCLYSTRNSVPNDRTNILRPLEIYGPSEVCFSIFRY